MKKNIFALLILSFISVAMAGPKINKEGTNKLFYHKHIDLADKFVLVLEGTVNDWKMKALADKMDDVEKDGVVSLVINSYGGSVDAGLVFINKLEAMKAQGKVKSLNCYIQNNAMSMAAIISSYCDGVLIHKFGSFMHHEASYGVQGQQSQIRSRVRYIEAFLDQVWEDVAKNYGLTKDELDAFVGFENFMSAKESVSFGLTNGLFNSLYHEGFVPEKPKSESLFFF